MEPLLLVDAGNTAVKFAVAVGGKMARPVAATHAEFGALAAEFAPSLAKLGVRRIAAALPRAGRDGLLEPFFDAIPGLELLRLSPDGPLPFRFDYAEGAPGADRLANVCALRELAPGRPSMVIDFGTATHIEIADAEGNFAGGVIFPGVETQLRSLAAATAGGLPEIEIGDIRALKLAANSTRGAMASGVVLSQAGAAWYFIGIFREEFGEGAEVFATGGNAEAPLNFFFTEVEHVPHLTLQGLLAWAKWRMGE